MPQAHAHFTHTYDADVQYSISPSPDKDGFYRVTIDGHGIYRARALRGGWVDGKKLRANASTRASS